MPHPFQIHRGTNASHWLSQSEKRGQQRRDWFTQADMRRIAGWGFDHLRLPIDEEQMYDEQLRREPEAFELMAHALDWAASANLRVIVDLHLLRSHNFEHGGNALFSKPAEAARFADIWRDLCDFLHDRPLDMVAYELLNEPVADDPADWNRVAHLALAAVREREKDRAVVLGSNENQASKNFDVLAVPKDDPAIILGPHYYNPFPLTHYRATWTDIGMYPGPVRYPGRLIEDADYQAVAHEPWSHHCLDGLKEWNRDVLASRLTKPLKVRQETGLPLYCGEFGCLHTVAQPDRVRWFRDIVSVFRELDISYSSWDYKGGFGLFKRDGSEDREVIDILTQG